MTLAVCNALLDTAVSERTRLAAIEAARPDTLRGHPALMMLLQEAAEEFRVPVAGVTLVGAERQIALASCGAPAEELETERAHSFCDHAIRTPDTLIVNDATADPRFAANPFVTGGPQVRFYAGAPLWIGDAQAFGALCVIGFEPRMLSLVERLRLRIYATAAQEIVAQHALTRDLLGMVSDTLQARFDAGSGAAAFGRG